MVPGAGHGTSAPHELTIRDRTLLVAAARMDQDTLAMVATDITERKQAEDALREADQRQHEFLGILSHELRNPLASSCRRTSTHGVGIRGDDPWWMQGSAAAGPRKSVAARGRSTYLHRA